MCLESKFTEREKREWLKKQPKVIKCWKTVYSAHGRYWPRCSRSGESFRKTRPNIIKGERKLISCYKNEYFRCHKFFYKPYFHLWKTERGAMVFGGRRVPCTVKKSKITTIGKQDGCLVIVAKEFDFAKKQRS